MYILFPFPSTRLFPCASLSANMRIFLGPSTLYAIPAQNRLVTVPSGEEFESFLELTIDYLLLPGPDIRLAGQRRRGKPRSSNSEHSSRASKLPNKILKHAPLDLVLGRDRIRLDRVMSTGRIRRPDHFHRVRL